MSDASAQPPRHTLFEDAQGLLYGAGMAAFGLDLLTSLGLVTGQTAGLAVLISYVTGIPFGPVFFVVNLPFYWFGWKRMGTRFTVKTFLSVLLLSLFSMVMPDLVQFGQVNPAMGAVLFGAITGSALLALFRHGASLGGIGIVALILQDKTGFRAGWAQMIFDAVLFAVSFAVVPPLTVLWSFLGAVVLNFVIAINHRRDRYVGT